MKWDGHPVSPSRPFILRPIATAPCIRPAIAWSVSSATPNCQFPRFATAKLTTRRFRSAHIVSGTEPGGEWRPR